MGNRSRPPQLGSAQEAILRLLVSGREMYGLEMVERSGGALKRGTIYVVASRLEGDGLLESREESEAERQPGQRGLPRRLYRITGDGRRALLAWDQAVQAWAAGEPSAAWGTA